MPANRVEQYLVGNQNTIGNVGAFPAFRDSLDKRYIGEVRNRENGCNKQSCLKDSLGSESFPSLSEQNRLISYPKMLGTIDADTRDADLNGYKNFEEWLFQCSSCVETGNSSSCNKCDSGTW